MSPRTDGEPGTPGPAVDGALGVLGAVDAARSGAIRKILRRARTVHPHMRLSLETVESPGDLRVVLHRRSAVG